MINFLELIENEKQKGYSEVDVGVKVYQDLCRKKISSCLTYCVMFFS